MDTKFSINILHILLFFLSLYLLITAIYNEFILTNKLYLNSLASQLTIDQINNIIIFKEKFGWITYIVNILVFLIKINFTTFCLLIGLFFAGINISYKKILKVVLITEFIFIINTGIRLILIHYNDFSTLEEIQHFMPFSLYSLFSPKAVPEWLTYPLSILNVAELLYWFLLAFGLNLLLKTSYLKSFKIVLTSYGTGLLLWVVLIIFIQVYFFDPTL